MLMNSSPNEGSPCAGQPRRMTKITQIPQCVSCEPLLSYQSPIQSGVEAGQEISLSNWSIVGKVGLHEEDRMSRTYILLGQSLYKGKVFKSRDCFLSNFLLPVFYKEYGL